MGLKKRNKTSAEFSMSSLTDIIFLLLIFFMLTSSMVQINFEIPESNSRTVAPTNIAVTLKRDNTYMFNGRKTTKNQINGKVRQELKSLPPEEKNKATLTIVAEKGVPWKKIYEIMEIANKNKMRAIIATQPKKS
ncbi:MAG TPA: biopolymer transporter ExbD [Saprospiraceae bacterium]|nr:biopolymer transporter ExbD [Saprospiraceae bacterium]HHH53046.1 biopolymer transporter ExbD [Bacteroidota bacterium]